jgi:hypothetical protein
MIALIAEYTRRWERRRQWADKPQQTIAKEPGESRWKQRVAIRAG